MTNQPNKNVDKTQSEIVADGDCRSDTFDNEPIKPALKEEHGHLNLKDIFKATAVKELTPFERKAALINAYAPFQTMRTYSLSHRLVYALADSTMM